MRKHSSYVWVVMVLIAPAMVALWSGTGCDGIPNPTPTPTPTPEPTATPEPTPGPADTFETSLHGGIRRGMETFYMAENDGLEKLTGVPYEDLACKNCHDKTRFTDYTGPGCADCHEDVSNPTGDIPDSMCLGCHSRQNAEKSMYDDVHATAGFACVDCHGNTAMHGDGNDYDSYLDPDYPQAACEDCHKENGTALVPPTTVTEHATHLDNLDCSACHMQSVITCYNCHFDSELAVDNNKRAFSKPNGYVMLVNREGKDKVYGATYMTLVNEQQTFVTVAPYYAHTITDQGRVCADCHANFGGDIPAIAEYNETGEITMTTWDGTAEGSARITSQTGIIPVPEQWWTVFQFDHLDYTGDPTTPAAESVAESWEFLGEETDAYQMLFAQPLTAEQMAALGANGPE